METLLPRLKQLSKKQKRRDDASTKKRISVVHRALSKPDLLTPVEVDRLVRVVFWKATHDDDSAEPAARFCAHVIMAELDGVFIDRLLWTCRNWSKQHDVLAAEIRCEGAKGSAAAARCW
ncbi:hypothetical protein MRX96_054727 [Rhipicephalus microplus]